MGFKAEQAISGTHGEAWINGEKFAEIFGLQAKIDILKEDVPMCGVNSGRGKKQMGWEGKGTVRFNKINSKLLKQQLDALRQGKELVVTIVSKVADPAAMGAERISIPNCTFDDITLADWESNKIIQEEKPFTFSEMPTLIDSIGA
ncbi:phage tail tube protein [Fictibacillus nanhaiensis]|uniref:phage tail tube protein n=1 Tax=Fictibacillus nanhaiensis TaxID=742169 RepID=UPI00203EC05B|nr:phage tail tube protein [Fictibacillus nanhaiensis]MCM3730071.1 phage tail tube protein [Fictibacillus nanhaiensis]